MRIESAIQADDGSSHSSRNMYRTGVDGDEQVAKGNDSDEFVNLQAACQMLHTGQGIILARCPTDVRAEPNYQAVVFRVKTVDQILPPGDIPFADPPGWPAVNADQEASRTE